MRKDKMVLEIVKCAVTVLVVVGGIVAKILNNREDKKRE